MKKLAIYLTLFFVCLSTVFAANTLTLNFYDDSGHDIDNVEVSVFECTDSSCDELTGTSTSDRIDNVDTGSTNTAALSIPSTSSRTQYIAYAFAEESDSYLPHYFTFAFTGDHASGSEDITLNKKDTCRSTIQSFSVTNSAEPGMPIVVDVAAALEADTYSAFQYTDDVYTYQPSTYDDWFSAETLITLTITKDVSGIDITVNTQSDTLEIMAEDSENVQFTWTPTTEGTYTATVETYVTDDQCESSDIQSESEVFEIVSEEDTGYCYTNINNLRIQEIEDGEVSTLQTGETYTVVFDKVSNAVSDLTFTPLATAIDVAVYDEEANLDYSFSDTMDANAGAFVSQEYSFSWTPESEGDNSIVVDGIATGCSYSTNNANTETLVIYVEGEDADTNNAPTAVCNIPTTLTVGEEGTFDGSASSDSDGFITTYSWTFGDGSISADTTSLYSYSTIGTYTAQLIVTDDDGATDSCSGTVTVTEVPNVAPTIDCSMLPTTGTVNEELSLTVYAEDSDGTISVFDWLFGDGNSLTTTTDTTTYTYTSTGTYTINIEVTDDDGDSASCSADITINEEPNVAPTIDCSMLPTAGTVDEELPLVVIATDSDGTITGFEWLFGDGSSLTTTTDTTTYTYTSVGTYTINVEVTDDDGDSASCSTEITINEEPNVAPTIDCSMLPTSGTVDEILALAVIASDSDGTITGFDWLFGDGSSQTTTVDTTTYAYTSAGTYIINVEVTDDDGDSASCSADIEITESGPTNEAPVALCIIPLSLLVGEEGPFDGSASYDTDGTIVSYAWNFGDGNTDSTSTTTHSYSAEGSYTTSLTVTDDDGATNSCSGTITVSEGTPEEEIAVEIIANPTSGQEPLTVEFSEIITNGIEPFTYIWNFDDGSTSTDAEPTHVFNIGTYIVTLTITDATGETAQDTETITVSTDLPAIAVASATPTSGEPTLWVQFSSEGSSGDEPLLYSWTFGDGESSTRANPGHYYDEEGTYTAVLTVTDADGDSDSDSVTITVGDELENVASRHYYVDGIAMSNDGRVKAGDTVELYIGAENIADIDKDTVAFNAIIQELGIYETTVEFDMDVGEKEVAVLSLDIPADTEPGTYYVRITISDDYVKRVIYRDIIVTD
ncbi:MAG: PKD domain-containing protein [Candidatus Woesearchaeota archaeon]|jgi:PKD repeat protein